MSTLVRDPDALTDRLHDAERGLIRPAPEDPARVEAYLPSPCVQNHAANIMPLPGGDLGCVWFGGTQEGIPDVSVYFSRLKPGGDQWSDPGETVRGSGPLGAEPDPVPSPGRPPLAAVDGADLRQPGYRDRPPPDLLR